MTKRLSKDERAALYERDEHDVFYSYEVRSLIDHIDGLEAENDEMRKALESIRTNEGRVCEEFESCRHGACASSYTAWAIADEALKTNER